jgi:hypothetical protein
MALNISDLIQELPADVRDYAEEAVLQLELGRGGAEGEPERAVSLPLLLYLLERCRPLVPPADLVRELTGFVLVTVIGHIPPDVDGARRIEPGEFATMLLEVGQRFVAYHPGLILPRE